jgi:hypothetical protein
LLVARLCNANCGVWRNGISGGSLNIPEGSKKRKISVL